MLSPSLKHIITRITIFLFLPFDAEYAYCGIQPAETRSLPIRIYRHMLLILFELIPYLCILNGNKSTHTYMQDNLASGYILLELLYQVQSIHCRLLRGTDCISLTERSQRRPDSRELVWSGFELFVLRLVPLFLLAWLVVC